MKINDLESLCQSLLKITLMNKGISQIERFEEMAIFVVKQDVCGLCIERHLLKNCSLDKVQNES